MWRSPARTPTRRLGVRPRVLRPRHGNRHLGRQAGAGLPGIRPGRRLRLTQLWRHRTGARDLGPHRVADGRPDRVESEPERGSTFSFTVRVGIAPGPGGARPCDVGIVAERAECARRRRQRDEPAHPRGAAPPRRMSAPTMASSGAEALAAIETAQRRGLPFRMLLVDVHMPGMDGFSFVAEAQRRFGVEGSTVVMLTSDRRPGDLDRCRELGLAAHLTKPIQHWALEQTMLGVIEPGGGGCFTRASRHSPPPRQRGDFASWWPKTTS